MSAVAKRKIEENIENSENNEVKKSKVGTPKNKKKSLDFCRNDSTRLGSKGEKGE